MQSETHTSSPLSNRSALTYAPPVLRILFVIDGRIGLDRGAGTFGLGYVLDTLSDQAWDVAVEVGIATREESISEEMRDGREVRYSDFKFTQSDFDIDQWDQIWFFADQPYEGDGTAPDTSIVPPYVLEDGEALALAEWMDRGGGVFATGDHGVLGASLCHRIPRVRTMRRWKVADRVPTKGGQKRNETLQGEGSDPERDTLLQPIELVTSRVVHSLPFRYLDRPHPLLCSDLGPIKEFPDHMHEGELVPDDEVDLDKPLDIPGYTRPEYPSAIPEIMASAIGDIGTAHWRPRPHIIAYGKTTHARYGDIVEPPEDLMAFVFRPQLPPKRFGLVGAYDGDPARVGRVVCDSTWHHWLSYNLVPIAEQDAPSYRKMQAFYRNVALWLARPTQRRAISLAAVWGVLTRSGPLVFSAVSDRHTAWGMGERAMALLGSWISPCWVGELVAAQLNATSLYLAKQSGEPDSPAPSWERVPEELVNRAVLGAMCEALMPLALEVSRAQRLRDDVEVDPKEIERCAALGVAEIPRLIGDSLDEAIEALRRVRYDVAAAEQRASKGPH